MSSVTGRYKLLSHGIYNSDGSFKPTSTFLNGGLIYSSEGFLSVQIYFQDLPQTNKDFLAYSGNYVVVSSNQILHNIHICSQNHRNNSVEKREYLIKDKILILSFEFEDKRKFEAQWEKLEF